MNIFGYALQIEKEAEAYYRSLAGGSDIEGLRRIFNWLADEELKHYHKFKELQKDEVSPLQETTILSDAKKEFEKIKAAQKHYHFDNSQVELYLKAQGLEQKSMDFYIKKSHEAQGGNQKEIFLKIAEEEKRHYFLLDNIIEFVRRPERWLENAEFNHLDEY